jgi:hypothetical protein
MIATVELSAAVQAEIIAIATERATNQILAEALLKRDEAAAILRVTPNNFRQIVHKKQLQPVGKRGRRTIFNRADVEALAATRGSTA